MKISPFTLKVLKNFYNLNQSVCFHPGNILKTISSSETVMAQATVEDDFPKEFRIHDISKFLNVLDLFDDPDLEIEEPFAVISQGHSTVQYILAGRNQVDSVDRVIELPKEVPCHFTLSNDNMQQLFKAITILGIPEVAFVGNGKKLLVQGIDTEEKIENGYSMEIGTTKNKFKVIFKIENINKLLPGDYEIKAAEIVDKVNGKKIKLSHFKNLNENIEYWVAVSSASEF